MKDRDTVFHSSVPIRLDGREWVLRYRAFAYIAYAEQTGRDLLLDMQAMGRHLSGLESLQLMGAAIAGGGGTAEPTAAAPPLASAFKIMGDVLWAGLVDAQPEVTRDAVQRMFGLQDFHIIAETITRAINTGMPQDAAARPIDAAPMVSEPQPTLSINGVPSPPISEPPAVSVPPNFSPLPPLIFGT